MYPEMICNEDRASWARDALDTFARETFFRSFRELEEVDRESEEGDAATAFRDLLTNLMHLARENGWDFGALAERAAGAFRDEVAEENR